MKLTVKWYTRDPAKIARIREKFGIPGYTTVNGLSPAEIDKKDLPLLKECASLGLIAILPFSWSRHGKHISFLKERNLVHN